MFRSDAGRFKFALSVGMSRHSRIDSFCACRCARAVLTGKCACEGCGAGGYDPLSNSGRKSKSEHKDISDSGHKRACWFEFFLFTFITTAGRIRTIGP